MFHLVRGMRVLFVSALAVAVSGSVVVPGLAAAAEQEGEEGEVRFIHGERGQLEIDASEGSGVFPAPQEPLNFESAEQFAEFAIGTLNAEVIYDEDGKVAGIEGSVTVSETPVYADPETREIIEVQDPIATLLGGRYGYFKVEGQEICVDPAACPDQPNPEDGYEEGLVDGVSPRSSLMATFKIKGSSKYTDLWFYKRVASETKQISGGWSRSVYFCWRWGFIPWVCSRTSGWNYLWTEGTMVDNYRQPSGWMGASGKNVTSVSVSHYRISLIPSACNHSPWRDSYSCKLRGLRSYHYGEGPEGWDQKSSCAARGC